MAASTSSSGSLSKSAQVRARLKHPVIDSDGHTVEFQPALREYIRQVAGPDLAGRYRTDGSNWYRMSWDQRRAERPLRPPWWALPTKNTLDRATATFPKLLHERLDQTGIDFAVLYPTAGLGAPHIREDELRRATCRAFNTFYADIFDRLTPAGGDHPDAYAAGSHRGTRTCGEDARAQGHHDGGARAPSDSRGRRDGAASYALRLLARPFRDRQRVRLRSRARDRALRAGV
jgi:hypothetical protein